jgi:DNA-binding HxlR family transcriptional regulator
LNELREARLLENGEQGYQLSRLGMELIEQFLPLTQWAQCWADNLELPTQN